MMPRLENFGRYGPDMVIDSDSLFVIAIKISMAIDRQQLILFYGINK